VLGVNDLYAADKWTLIRLAKAAGRLGVRVGGDVHFMVDPVYLNQVASLTSGDDVFEVGFGLCYLTNYLTRYARRVSACDVNPTMVKVIRALGVMPIYADLFICDALTYTPPPGLTVVSNIPYSITSPLLLRMLTSYGARRIIVTLQREVAKRLTAKPSSRDYGRLSVIAQCLSSIRVIRDIPPWAFWPRPRVYSTIVELTPLLKPCGDVKVLESLTGKIFTQPNRRVVKVLRHFYGLSESNVPRHLLNKRVRDLAAGDVIELAKILVDMGVIGNNTS